MSKLLKSVLISTLITVSIQADVKSFANINDAVNSFVTALKTGDQNTLEAIFSKRYHDIVSEKEIGRGQVNSFLQAYSVSHRLASFDANEVYIAVGKNDWTFPIPLVQGNDGWHYDMKAGKENMKTRSIGRNELALISALENLTSLELLQKSELVYIFIKDSSGRIVAQPKSYDVDAIMSFVLTPDGSIYEADLEERDYEFGEHFKLVHEDYLNRK